MSELLNPTALLANKKAFRWILRATLVPVTGRGTTFQPTNFPEVGSAIYGAKDNRRCIVDSPASMANHLEKVCTVQDELTPELAGLPYLRCVTDGKDGGLEVVATSLGEGHRMASTYFLEGKRRVDGTVLEKSFGAEVHEQMGLKVAGKGGGNLPPGVAHPSDFWKVIQTVFAYDPNALVHGVLFPKWQLKIPRALTVHHEASGVAEVQSSGVKFDRLGKTNSGQPIFSVQRITAEKIEVTAVLDLAFIRSLGREGLGLDAAQKELLVALSFWKLGRLFEGPFKFRANCDLELDGMAEVSAGGQSGQVEAESLVGVGIGEFIRAARFPHGDPLDIYWPNDDLYKKGEAKAEGAGRGADGDSGDEDGTEDDT